MSGHVRKAGKASAEVHRTLRDTREMNTVAYQLVLSLSISGVHEVFHVSMLQKYTLDPAHVVDWGEIFLDTEGTFEEGLVLIMDSLDQVL